MAFNCKWLNFEWQPPKAPPMKTEDTGIDTKSMVVELIVTLMFGDITHTTGINVTYLPGDFPETPTGVFHEFEDWFANVDGEESDYHIFEGKSFKTGVRRQDIVMYQINVHRVTK